LLGEGIAMKIKEMLWLIGSFSQKVE
jgi:hypothetical protein